MRKIIFLIIAASITMSAATQDIQISQVDTNRLLLKGEIDIYFTASGTPESDDFNVSEKTLGELDIKSFDTAPNRDSGIDFLLLIDNSGSMYEESYQGSKRHHPGETRS